MMSLEGFPQMYIYKCKSYPLCNLDYDEIISNNTIIKVNEINNIAIWTGEKSSDLSPIRADQEIMIVKCPENYDSCRIQTSIFGNKDHVTLNERQPFTQMIYKGEKEEFLVDFQYEKGISRIFIDLLIITGDVSITLKNTLNGQSLENNKNYLANKIYYSLKYKDYSDLKNITIIIEAKIHSYYILEYKLVRTQEETSVNNIYSGINYLIPITNNKNINIHNFKLLSNSYYLTNFHSLNCKFKIERIGTHKEIVSFGNYAQQFIKDDDDIKKTVHSYQAYLIDGRVSNSESNKCMLYVSALELTKENSSIQKELLIGDGVPQRIIFENGFNKIVVPNVTNNTKTRLLVEPEESEQTANETRSETHFLGQIGNVTTKYPTVIIIYFIIFL